MANDVSIKFKVDGEQQFQSAIKGINAEIKNLDSQFKLAITQMSNMADTEKATASATEALTKKKEALTQKEENLTKKLESQHSALRKVAEELENAQKAGDSEKVNKLSASYNNLAKACSITSTDLNKTKTEIINCDKAMEDLNSNSMQAGTSLTDMSSGVGLASGKLGTLGTVAKAGAIALASLVASAGALAVTLGKQVVEAYADFEQLEGGIETLFGKDVFDKVAKNAYNAYKTAGLSANQYMETVTSFSASLINSLAGDTVKAVELSDMAIQDMSDNANKMGTDMSAIQNAYQGFAKQNYTMLDNLKLGYGGTKTEMERLIEDANKLREAQGKNADLTISKYSDIITAIHEIQTAMDITGTTAKEAEGTITGSINMLKASWANLLTYLGDGTEQVYDVMNNFTSSLSTVIENITPVIENIISYLPNLIQLFIETISNMLPTLLETASGMFEETLNALMDLLPNIIPFVVDAVLTIVNTLVENLPLLTNCAVQIVLALTTGLAQAMPELVPAIVDAIILMETTLLENIPLMIEAGFQLFFGLIEGMIKALPVIIKQIPTFYETLFNALKDGFTTIIKTAYTWGKDLLQNFIDGLSSKIQALKGKVSEIAQTVRNFLGFSEPKEGPLSNFHTYAPDMMKLFAQGMTDNIGLIKNASSQVASSVNIGGNNAVGYGMANSSPIQLSINLDGQEFARAIFDPMQNETLRRGTSLVGV